MQDSAMRVCVRVRGADGLGNASWESFSSMKRVVFFFFQAEDGIRDLYVTGVQTCALPISTVGVVVSIRTMVIVGAGMETMAEDTAEATIAIEAARGMRADCLKKATLSSSSRSEERRVGKECRSRWWASHLKTNENDGYGVV